ncbi:MAG: DUF445 family protein [Clostridia bacterium]|nr:DUF445 family protein [Clostridia bacterium]
MNYSIIIRPLIGATIGYVTNWIAVKMMFRPLHPIKIGNFTLPFTPGIIPKNQHKLAEVIGNTISNTLLTSDDFKTVLLSNDIKEYITLSIKNYMSSLEKQNSSIKDITCNYINDDNYSSIMNALETSISNSIYNCVLDSKLGTLITNQIELAAKEKLKGSMLGILGGNAIISSFIPSINERLDEYIQNNGKTLIQEMVKKELNKYSLIAISDISILEKEFDINTIVINIYEKIVENHILGLLQTINISQMVTKKINSMDVLELEKLLLQIMKKELNALVNLGALIGFILGFFNLLV